MSKSYLTLMESILRSLTGAHQQITLITKIKRITVQTEEHISTSANQQISTLAHQQITRLSKSYLTLTDSILRSLTGTNHQITLITKIKRITVQTEGANQHISTSANQQISTLPNYQITAIQSEARIK
ncbi:MAG: hypothetical protein IPN86_14895 [Saprospiraceae bacterium]|nr:hypothetical protein [Saprospiraceae bacterium]